MIATAEPISPELVLVSDDDLRVAAISALPAVPSRILSFSSRLISGERLDWAEVDSPSRASLVTEVVIYLGWHLAVGAVIALGAVSAIAIPLMVLSMLD
jgi:hypothetical protein